MHFPPARLVSDRSHMSASERKGEKIWIAEEKQVNGKLQDTLLAAWGATLHTYWSCLI